MNQPESMEKYQILITHDNFLYTYTYIDIHVLYGIHVYLYMYMYIYISLPISDKCLALGKTLFKTSLLSYIPASCMDYYIIITIKYSV